MRTIPSSLSAVIAGTQVFPRYVARFFHVASISQYPFSADFATGSVSAYATSYYPALDYPRGNTQTVNVMQGTSTIGTIQILLVETKSSTVLQYMSNPGAGLSADVTSAATTISASVAGGLTAAYPPFGTIELTSGQATERIRYATLTDSQFGTVALPVSRGVDGTSVMYATAPLSVQNGEQIRPLQRMQLWVGDDSVNFSQYMSYIMLEVAQRDLVGPGQYQITCQDLQRYLKRYAFLDAAPDTSSATNTLTRHANPLTTLMQVWTTTSGPTKNGSFDQLDGRGAGIPITLTEAASVIALRDAQFPNDIYRYLFRNPVEVKPWGENLLQSLNCYTFVTQSGTLSVKRMTASGTAVASLDMNVIIGTPKWVAGDPLIANQITYLYDWGEQGGPTDYTTRETFSSENSVRKYGRKAPVVVEMPGVRTSNSGTAITLNRATRFFERFADPPPVLEMDVHWSQLGLEIGDTVTVTHSFVPNLATGQLGINSATFEITDISPKFSLADGPPRLSLKLLNVGAVPLPPAPISSVFEAFVGYPPGTVTLDMLQNNVVQNFVQFTDDSVRSLGPSGADLSIGNVTITTCGGRVDLFARVAPITYSEATTLKISKTTYPGVGSSTLAMITITNCHDVQFLAVQDTSPASNQSYELWYNFPVGLPSQTITRTHLIAINFKK